MIAALKTLLKQPYWIGALFLGAALVALPCIDFGKDHLTTHAPSSFWLLGTGIALLVLSSVAFALTLPAKHAKNTGDVGAGLDMTRVTESSGVLSTTVSGCEIRVVNGHIEDFSHEPGIAIVLPCNEYFDDQCASDTRSALGAYVNRVFEGQAAAFIALMKSESNKKLGSGTEQSKTDDERAVSFGAGRCLLLIKPLDRAVSVALVSTTTQRASQGLAARISYLFNGMHDLAARLADARFNEVAMPVLAAGHGGIDPPLALVGLLLAVAEVARYGQGGQCLRRVTIVVFRQDADHPAEIDPAVVRRALALIGSQG
jgi:hypothetical protein